MSYYFDKETTTASRETTTLAQIKNKTYTFKTDNNVFSKKGLDFGTRTLLENIDLSDINGDVLDLGCGYGPIGIFIKSSTNANVDMIDINERAVNLARKNANINQVDVNIFESNIYSNITKKYNYIITNPPIRVGKNILYQILILHLYMLLLLSFLLLFYTLLFLALLYKILLLLYFLLQLL